MCLRGVPELIFSDNATNFKCASKILKTAIKQVDGWRRSVKSTIDSIFPLRYTPNDELLLSVLAEAANIINSRPLTYVPLENDLDEALTPNHFILGSSNGIKSIGSCVEGGFDLRNSWRQSQSYADKIWQKWIKTILPELLRRRDKWLRDSKLIQIDDIVLVVDENAPRNSYKKAKVIGLNHGTDGKVRSVTIQTSGEYT